MSGGGTEEEGEKILSRLCYERGARCLACSHDPACDQGLSQTKSWSLTGLHHPGAPAVLFSLQK